MGIDDVHMRKRGFSLAFLALFLLVITKYYSCEAVHLAESNSSSFHCNGHLDECLISEEIELEFLMESLVIRVLQGAPGGVSGSSEIKDQPVIKCPPGYAYNTAAQKCLKEVFKAGQTE